MPFFSSASKQKLVTCDYRLQLLLNVVIRKYDCIVLEGYRSPERQAILYEEGKTKVKKSKHNSDPSLAIDVCPYPIPKEWGESDVKELAKFYHFAGYLLGLAEMLNIPLRWGGDWDNDKDFGDQNFDDLVHFEIDEEEDS